MPSKHRYTRPTITIVIALLVVIIALPQSKRQWAPFFLHKAQLHYGLDLVGGTQLDFRISEHEMLEQIEVLRKEITLLEEQGAPADQIAALRNQRLAIEDQQRSIVEHLK